MLTNFKSEAPPARKEKRISQIIHRNNIIRFPEFKVIEKINGRIKKKKKKIEKGRGEWGR